MKIKYLYGLFLIYSLFINNAYASDDFNHLDERYKINISLDDIMNILSNKEISYIQREENFKDYFNKLEDRYTDAADYEVAIQIDDEGNNALHLCIKNSDIEACTILLNTLLNEDDRSHLFLTKNKNGHIPTQLLADDWQHSHWTQIGLASEGYLKLDLKKKEQELQKIKEDCRQNPELDCHFDETSLNSIASLIKICPEHWREIKRAWKWVDMRARLKRIKEHATLNGFGANVHYNSHFRNCWKESIENNSSGNFLDIGCGNGANAYCPNDFAGHYYANDLDKIALFALMTKWPEESLERLSLIDGNCLEDDFSFADNSFDGIMTSHLFHYFDGEECDKALSKFFAMLKPGGKFTLIAFSIFYDGFWPKDSLCNLEPSKWPGVFSIEHREKLNIKTMKQGFILSFLVKRLKEYGFEIEDAYYFDSLHPDSELYPDPFTDDETLNWPYTKNLKFYPNSLPCSIGIIAKKPL